MLHITKYFKYEILAISLLFIGYSQIVTAQNEDSTTKKTNHFSTMVTIQNKGISTIPNLTLGDPAIIFDMKLGRKLTFEPQFRFSLKDGKPWAIVLWGRYYATFTEKFKVTFHVNHSLSYKAITLYNADGTERDVINTTRYLAGAMSPNYQFNKYLSLGAYLFYSRGLDANMTQNTYMPSFRPAISNIPIAGNIVGRIAPEVYYLKMDANSGVFFNARVLISKKDSPFTVSGLINKPISSEIPSGFDFLWNVGVSYSFNKKFVDAQ